MPLELDTTTIAVIVFVGLLAHVALVAVSKWINPVLLLAGFFLLMTPLAVAEIPGQSAAKWGRVYITLLIVLVGVPYSKHYKIGPAFGAYLLFAAAYVLAGIWSDRIITALIYKGLYLVLVIAGGFMAYSVRSEWDLRKGVRLFVVISGLIALIMLTDFVRNPAAISSVGRFEPWGLVATRVGAICGPLGVICAFCALYDRVKFWKIVSYCSGGALALCIVYSGSRGGLFMAGVGCFVIGLPVIKRPILAASVLIFGFLIFLVVKDLASAGDSEATERLMEVNFDSRAEKWAHARAEFSDKMLFGHGWVFDTKNRASGATDNLHSIYFQVAVEMGMFGLIVFGSTLSLILSRILWVLRKAKRYRTHVEVTYLSVGLMACILSYGVVESGVLMGGTIVAMLLAFAFALLDRISELIDEEIAWEGIDPDADEYWEYDHHGPEDDWGSEGDEDAPINEHESDYDEDWDSRVVTNEDLVDGH